MLRTVILIILIVLLAAILVGSIYVIQKLLFDRSHYENNANLWREMMEMGGLKCFREMPSTPYWVKTRDGSRLYAQFYDARDWRKMKNEDGVYSGVVEDETQAEKRSKRYVILTHGYRDGRVSMLRFLPIFLKRGYNCVIYDLRGHGSNRSDRRDFCTFGPRESEDLLDVIEDTRERFDKTGEGLEIGLLGESLGGSASLMALSEDQRLQFVIADSAFADFGQVLGGYLRRHHMPSFIAGTSSFLSGIFFRNPYAKVHVSKALTKNRVPLCLIHGAKDRLVSPLHSQKLVRETQGYSELHLLPDATHARCINQDEKGYEMYIDRFLNKLDVTREEERKRRID